MGFKRGPLRPERRSPALSLAPRLGNGGRAPSPRRESGWGAPAPPRVPALGFSSGPGRVACPSTAGSQPRVAPRRPVLHRGRVLSLLGLGLLEGLLRGHLRGLLFRLLAVFNSEQGERRCPLPLPCPLLVPLPSLPLPPRSLPSTAPLLGVRKELTCVGRDRWEPRGVEAGEASQGRPAGRGRLGPHLPGSLSGPLILSLRLGWSPDPTLCLPRDHHLPLPRPVSGWMSPSTCRNLLFRGAGVSGGAARLHRCPGARRGSGLTTRPAGCICSVASCAYLFCQRSFSLCPKQIQSSPN